MPELPEVQTVVNGLKDKIKGAKILDIKILNKSTLDDVQSKTLHDKSFIDVSRQGKYIVFSLGDKDLVVHLRMTGQFFFFDSNISWQQSPYDRVIFQLDKGLLVFRDVRKFATMNVVDHHLEITQKLGLDPTHESFTFENFEDLIKSSKGRIKAFLLDQEKLSGLGNIYADEVLYECRIHPNSFLEHLNSKSIKSLHAAIVSVLKEALKHEGTSLGEGLGNYRHINGEGKNQIHLKVYGRHEKACLSCQKPLQKTKAAGRGSTFCQHCQILY
jgi:formamidopyrimidine-DNA glycosylase